MSCTLFSLLPASVSQNNFAVFQPSEGLLSGGDFETSLKLPRPPEGATEKVSLEVPHGIRLVRPESKPGWQMIFDGTSLIFEAQKDTGLGAAALEFQLHVVAGCEFPNASDAVTMPGDGHDRHLLLWQTVQYLRAFNGSLLERRWTQTSTEAEAAPFLEVTSDKACRSSASEPGMQWLGQHVPAASQVSGLEEKVVGLEEDRTFDGHDFLKPHDHRSRRGVQAGMAFGRPSHQGQTTTSHVRWPMWKVLGLLSLIMFIIVLGTLLVAFVASAWARLLMSSSRQALLKDAAKESCHEVRGPEERHLIESTVLGKRRSDDRAAHLS